MTTYGWIVIAAAVLASAGAAQRSTGKPAATAAQPITVYKTASCGCCGKWAEHLKQNGFAPTIHTVQTTDAAPPAKGVPQALRSCHTATLEGYTIEGHVPADVIKKMLKERPKVAGLAVPGMPAGSPGMESSNPQPYEVIAFDAAGKTSVYAKK
jgi:hypothetical protein